MKRPSFQWYPADWRNNSKLRRCSWAERGVWVETIGLMHDSDEYGVLRWPLKEIAQALGCKLTELSALVRTRVMKGADAGERFEGFTFTPLHAGKRGQTVTLIEPCDGPIWFSSRLVEDEYKRTVRSPKPGDGEAPKVKPKGGFGVASGKSPTPHPSRGGACADPSSSSSSTPSGGSNNHGEESTSLAVQIAVALRPMGVKNASGMNPDVVSWAEAGVTVEQAVEAARMAIEERGIKQPSTGYLTPILNDMRSPPKARVVAPGAGKPWFLSWEKIVEKGAEKGFAESDFDSPPAFRAAVFAECGITDDDVRKAEADWRVAA